MKIKEKLKPIHPFAARMAPEIAFEALQGLEDKAIILDPMVGSGTVLRTISSLGYNGLGIDIDPLAVMMSKAWTTRIHDKNFLKKANDVIKRAKGINVNSIHLPWIDTDKKTKDFIAFWFADEQIHDLRKLSFVINDISGKYSGLLKIAMSKLIITKSKGASLAADISHSRPHKVFKTNEFDVLKEYEKVCLKLAKLMESNPPLGKITVNLGDARKLKIKDQSVDSIITSPPYLNAIDYMRGHKLALVWLGYKIDELSAIRGKSIGAEKSPNTSSNINLAKRMVRGIKGLEKLPQRKTKMIFRYALDMTDLMRESARVLKRNCKATFVIGNSIIQGVYIENTLIAEEAAKKSGLKLIARKEREIPQNRRYLPPPSKTEASSFNLRMRTETVMTFIKTK